MSQKSNPYASPEQTAEVTPHVHIRGGRSLAGFFLALLMMLPYGFVLAMSLYEYSRSTNQFASVDYVRHALASGLFLLICIVAARGFWKGYRWARIQLLVSPILLAVFYYPGLNAVWNFGARLLGP